MKNRFTWLALLWAMSGCQPASVEIEKHQSVSPSEVPVPVSSHQTTKTLQEELPQTFITRKAIGQKEGCNFKDGTHPATVDYYNPDTGHKAAYDLKVHITNCAVVRINFPNGGWLDEDHIPATALDRHGNAKLTDDKGRRWEVNVRSEKK